MTDNVIRWVDNEPTDPLANQLRARPEAWAVIDENLPGMAWPAREHGIARRLGPGFEVETVPCDDGPYGVLYEIRARYIGEG